MSVESKPLYTTLPPFAHKGFEHVECISVVYLKKNNKKNKIKMDKSAIFSTAAVHGYIVCFAAQCPLKDQCLRWKVGEQMPTDRNFCQCINPHYQDVGTAQCPHFRKAEKVIFAKGMLHVFNDMMPKKVEAYVREQFLARHCRTYYYEYRNGERLMPPSVQEEIRQYFREAGWHDEIVFDGYEEDYEW